MGYVCGSLAGRLSRGFEAVSSLSDDGEINGLSSLSSQVLEGVGDTEAVELFRIKSRRWSVWCFHVLPEL